MAVLVLFGVPFRRRKWQTMLGLVLLCAAAMGPRGAVVRLLTLRRTAELPPGLMCSWLPGRAATITQTAEVAVTVQ